MTCSSLSSFARTCPLVILSPDLMRISRIVPLACGITATERIASPVPMALNRSLTTPRTTACVATRTARIGAATAAPRPCPLCHWLRQLRYSLRRARSFGNASGTPALAQRLASTRHKVNPSGKAGRNHDKAKNKLLPKWHSRLQRDSRLVQGLSKEAFAGQIAARLRQYCLFADHRQANWPRHYRIVISGD